jgi:hypothetical protein
MTSGLIKVKTERDMWFSNGIKHFVFKFTNNSNEYVDVYKNDEIAHNDAKPSKNLAPGDSFNFRLQALVGEDTYEKLSIFSSDLILPTLTVAKAGKQIHFEKYGRHFRPRTTSLKDVYCFYSTGLISKDPDESKGLRVYTYNYYVDTGSAGELNCFFAEPTGTHRSESETVHQTKLLP